MSRLELLDATGRAQVTLAVTADGDSWLQLGATGGTLVSLARIGSLACLDLVDGSLRQRVVSLGASESGERYLWLRRRDNNLGPSAEIRVDQGELGIEARLVLSGPEEALPSARIGFSSDEGTSVSVRGSDGTWRYLK